jgi:sugar O-acyltransferase (sialic acid O-acetyltransferase NeuD family)
VPLLILGAGGHGRVVAETAIAAGLTVAGFLDEDASLLRQRPLGLPVLGNTETLEHTNTNANALGLGVGRNSTRLALLQRFASSRWSLPRIIHPRAWLSPSAVVGPATVVMANASVQTACQLGAAVIINTNASVDHDCVLADGVHVSPGAHLAGNVTVGEGTHIGIGASVIEGIRIGANCLIAAGAVVVRDVPDGQRVAGVPAHPMKSQEHP